MAEFKTATPATGVSVTTAGEVCVLSIGTLTGRPLDLDRIKIGARSVTVTDLPMQVRIVQADTDGTGTTNTPVALDERVTASIPTGKHTYSANPTANLRTIWSMAIPPQSVGEFSLVNPATGRGLMIPASKFVGVWVTPFTATQVVDAELVGRD